MRSRLPTQPMSDVLVVSWCGRSSPTTASAPTSPPASGAPIFCRLEHVVPWAIQGAHWEAGALAEPPALERGRRAAAPTAAPSSATSACSLVRHRGEHRIADDFCSVDHLLRMGEGGRALALRRRVLVECRVIARIRTPTRHSTRPSRSM